MHVLRCFYVMGCLVAGPAFAVSFDNPLPPGRIQATASLASGQVLAEEVLRATYPAYDPATHCAGPIKIVGLVMQALPYDQGTLAVAVKQEACPPDPQTTPGEHAWQIEAWLLKPAASGGLRVSAHGLLPEAQGLQRDDGGSNDDAVLEGFDFAKFDTAPGQRAFGLRWHAFSSGTGAATESHQVTLCWNEGGMLHPVLTFAAKEIETNVSAPSEEATSDTVTRIRTLRVLPSRTQGHYDWQVAERSGPAVTYRWQGGRYAQASPKTHKEVTAESVLRGMH